MPTTQRTNLRASERRVSPAWAGALLFAAVALGGCVGGLGDAGPAGAHDATDLSHLFEDDTQATGETKEFDLYLHPMEHSPYPGVTMQMWGFSFSEDASTAQMPGPEIRVTEGDRVVVRFHNLLEGFLHTIHWHGVHVPVDQDGVPHISQPPVAPGETWTYEFTAKPSGTFWYHCHVDTEHHTMMGMFGPLIIEPQDPAEDPAFDREETLMLWGMDKNHITTLDPTSQNRPKDGDPYSYETWARRQTQDGINNNERYGEVAEETGVRERRDWYPDMFPPFNAELNTFGVNQASFPWTEPVFIPDDGVIRLRLVSVNVFTTWHLHGHYMVVTHKDGGLLAHPYKADTLLIGPGERYSVYVYGNNPGVWMMHSHAPGQTQNDDIWPGGMMTELVYDSLRDQARSGGHDHGGGSGGSGSDGSSPWHLPYEVTAGDFLDWYAR